MEKIKLLIVDDHQIVRDGLRSQLETEVDFLVVGDTKGGRDALDMVHRCSVDVVLMDVGMAEMNGIEATRQILQYDPEIKILALSGLIEDRYITAMLKSGAAGYLKKDCSYEELSKAIRLVAGGKKYLTSEITELVVRQIMDEGNFTGPAGQPSLSPREREVLQLLAEGNSVKQIANKLFVSISTVETHRRHIMEKLDMRSIAELTKYAIREGITFLNS